jgi:Raf kinase inhibitor-like YbhB/YbcL family protein
MKIWSNSFADGQPIPGEFAFCVPDPASHVAMAPNRNPHLAWSGAPEGTKSFVVLCVDPDVPSVGDDVNQEGKTVPKDLPRVDFAHWLLFDIPADRTEIAAGSHSDGITARGKHGPEAPGGMRHGLNDYTNWFAGDADMEGDYFGYDGPCPPWNDARMHHYTFSVHALDIPRLDIADAMTLENVREAMRGHVLAEARITGTYTLNPALLG